MTNKQILEKFYCRDFRFERELLPIIKGNDMNFMENGEAPLHAAVKTLCGKLLTAVIYKTENINIQDKNGNTALHIAVLWGWYHGAEKLLQKGACANIKNNENKTPADICKHIAENYNEDFYQLLDILEHQEKVFDFTNERNAALNKAVSDDDVEFVKELLEVYKLDSNEKHGKMYKLFNTNSLFFVQSPEMAKLLIEAGAEVNCTNKFGDTPLKCAKGQGLHDVVNVFFENGAK